MLHEFSAEVCVRTFNTSGVKKPSTGSIALSVLPSACANGERCRSKSSRQLVVPHPNDRFFAHALLPLAPHKGRARFD